MSHSIVVENLGKRFRRFDPYQPKTLQESFLKLFQRTSPQYFWGLRNVSFKVPAGQMVGVIGHNGAGKSTLLRLIGGIGRPEEGGVQTRGQIGALLDLGVGFHPDLTGRENVFVSGVIAGLTRRQVKERFVSIVEFAELETFIDYPLRTYSTGMRMRLAFAVAVHIDPDILLIDEALAVGDMAFQQKCLDRIAQFKAQGCTILLVSHDVSQIQALCDQVLWLRNGEVVAYGAADVVVGQYQAEMKAETEKRTPEQHPPTFIHNGTELRVNENRFGSLEMKIVKVRLLDVQGKETGWLESGDPLQVEVQFRASFPVDVPIFGVTISNEDGLICYETSTATAGLNLGQCSQGKITLQIERLDLSSGTYFVDVGIYEKDWAYAYDYHWHVYLLIIEAYTNEPGFFRPPHRWKYEEGQKATLDYSMAVETTR